MIYSVLLTDNAVMDLEELYVYLDKHSVDGRADHVLSAIEKVFSSLAEDPERGSFPKELLNLGIREFREIYFKSYRIIYRIINTNVYIMVIAHGRRDMDTLLQNRLLLH